MGCSGPAAHKHAAARHLSHRARLNRSVTHPCASLDNISSSLRANRRGGEGRAFIPITNAFQGRDAASAAPESELVGWQANAAGTAPHKHIANVMIHACNASSNQAKGPMCMGTKEEGSKAVGF